MKIAGIYNSKRNFIPFFLAVIIFICLAPPQALSRERNKILLIGLDGAGWNVMTPMIEEGKLPNIKRLMDNGSWGRIETLTPVTSEIIWTTIATGMAPDVHGITANLMQDPDTGELISPTSNLRKVKAIWNILSEHKKRVGVVGYRVSWPAERVNEVIISERASDARYRSLLGYSEPPFEELCSARLFNSFKNGSNMPGQIKDGKWIFDRDIFMSNAAKFLLKNKEFDFFCFYLRGIDEASHYYWRYMSPEGEVISAADVVKYKNIIRDYYIWCDGVIGDLLKIIDKNTDIIIVSDHGFKAGMGREYIFSKVDSLLEACGLKEFNYNSKKVKLDNLQSNVWEYNKNIRITGELTDEEFNAVCENAKNVLNNIKGKDTGARVFKVSKNTDRGFIIEPDEEYINENRGGYILINGLEYRISDFLTVDPMTGEHDETDTIIIMSGKDVRRRGIMDGSSIYDIAPTVLYLLGLPLAKDMRGKVLAGAIDPKFLAKRPVTYIDTYEDEKLEGAPKPVRSPEDERIIKERMRSLGYIN